MEEMFKKFSMTPEMLEQRNEAEAQLKFLAEKDHDYSTTRTEKKKMLRKHIKCLNYIKY